jgi:inner membrane protein involved in colicin E2 resistance
LAKFYIKSVLASMAFMFLLLLFFNLIKGIDVSLFHKKIISVLIATDLVFLLVNEKMTIREVFRWYHWLFVVSVFLLFSFVLFFL